LKGIQKPVVTYYVVSFYRKAALHINVPTYIP
jgi:hypothetical protein